MKKTQISNAMCKSQGRKICESASYLLQIQFPLPLEPVDGSKKKKRKKNLLAPTRMDIHFVRVIYRSQQQNKEEWCIQCRLLLMLKNFCTWHQVQCHHPNLGICKKGKTKTLQRCMPSKNETIHRLISIVFQGNFIKEHF